jgi:hypothetical protein
MPLRRLAGKHTERAERSEQIERLDGTERGGTMEERVLSVVSHDRAQLGGETLPASDEFGTLDTV